MAEHHTILGGKVHVYKRTNSSNWQCATYLAGKNRRTTSKEDSLSKAKEFAEDWYLRLRGKLRDGELKGGKSFRETAKLYLREFDIMTQGQRSPTYARGLSSSKRSFTPCCQDILYSLGFSAQRSTAVDRWALRSISRTRVVQK
jgi:hypothetical protein